MYSSLQLRFKALEISMTSKFPWQPSEFSLYILTTLSHTTNNVELHCIAATKDGRATDSTHQAHQANTNVYNQNMTQGLQAVRDSVFPRTCGK